MLIKNAIIVNEGQSYKGSVLVIGSKIQGIYRDGEPLPRTDDTLGEISSPEDDEVVDAEGMYLLPGIIDDHVHMRDPGLTHKADMESETRAAAAGGVTSVMDMPNVVPQTTTIALWSERMDYAREHCHVNYAFYLGATNDNLEEIKQIDTSKVPALKLFMGSSTGGMLVDREAQLREIFKQCPTLIMTHCEDTSRINERMSEAKQMYGYDPDVVHHPLIRDDEACYRSSALAVRLAQETGARLHIAHITSKKELSLLPPSTSSDWDKKKITAELCPQHLYFCDQDYLSKGTLIKCNPSIKSVEDRKALREALRSELINIIGTDHAPHLLSEKEGGAQKAVSGMPLVQFSLPLMLTMAGQGLCSMERIVEVMCHNPARLFHVQERGYIRPGYKADLVLVKAQPWQVKRGDVISKCGWTPLEGTELQWAVHQTFVNGKCVFESHRGIDDTVYGEALIFEN